MPQIKAAFKDIKQNKKRRLRNESVVSEIKTLLKKFGDFADNKDAANAKKLLPLLVKKINKAKSKGVIHRKTASRKISRITKKAARFK